MVLVSIIGDSISTFEGYNPPNYAVYYDKEKQALNGLTSVYDTWWAKVNQSIHAYLCVNNSYSGSRVTGKAFPAASSSERISRLRTMAYTPDIVLINIGFNDFGSGVKVRKKRASLFKRADCSYFEEAYELMIEQIKEQYPRAKVVCGTILRSKLKTDEKWTFPEEYAGVPLEDYNYVIRQTASKKNVFLADVAAYESRYETLDGTHPTAEGHQTIANAWLKCLLESDVLEPTIESCIKMYRVNRDNDLAVYMVFEALVREKVLMAFDSNNNLAGIPYNDNIVIPVFTSPNEFIKNEPISLRAVYLQDNIDTLISLKKHLVVNPFSSVDKQFIVPYEAITKMLKPFVTDKHL